MCCSLAKCIFGCVMVSCFPTLNFQKNIVVWYLMAENEKRLQDLLVLNNTECADCRTRHNIEYASYNIGIFLCTRCKRKLEKNILVR